MSLVVAQASRSFCDQSDGGMLLSAEHAPSFAFHKLEKLIPAFFLGLRPDVSRGHKDKGGKQ
jgi:hypothetical protein